MIGPISAILAVVGLLALLGPGPAGAGDASRPTDQVREYTDRVIQILEDAELPPAERRLAVRRLAAEAFDVTETARRALGRHWRERTTTEQQEFVRLFADLLEQTYIARIDEYGGERVRYVSEQVDGDTALVRARIISRRGPEVPVESRLLRQGDRWLIYDVVVENVSLVGNYRSQFDRIIRTTSYDELVRRLRARTDVLGERELKTDP